MATLELARPMTFVVDMGLIDQAMLFRRANICPSFADPVSPSHASSEKTSKHRDPLFL